MSPSVRKKLGACEIISLIGAGGMGKVYKALDTRLGREVALKILLDEFASDPERMARLAREARILASLNHPNIASIYSLEECDGSRALVMEYIEGPTLSDRLRSGPIPVTEALPLASQIAEALQYAHSRGVIHRDLKPANVKLTREGTVKLLDFGLARALEAQPDSIDPATSPTLSLAATRAGVILGTAGYMSPEQARGKPADRQCDIWGFGVVLFEMVSGQRLFARDTVMDSLAAVLKEPVDWSQLPAETPPAIRRLLRRCLERDPKLRLNDIGDACLEIRDAEEDKREDAAVSHSRTRLTLLSAAALVLAVSLGFAAWQMVPRPSELPLMVFSADMGANAALISSFGPNAAISPDGTRIAFVVRNAEGQTQLATRLLARPETVVLPGTEGAENPFFSPDGEWVGFFTPRKLKKVPVTGGAAVDVCPARSLTFGAAWGEDDTIIAALRTYGGLEKVSSSGGEPKAVTQPDERDMENAHRWPQILPGGDSVLFTAGMGPLSIQETGKLVVQSLKDGRRKVLWRGGYYGRYLPSGHLIYMQRGTAFAVPFDPGKQELTGTPVPVLNDVTDNPLNGGTLLDFSRTGIVAFVSGKSRVYTSQPAWIDRDGKAEAFPAPPGTYLAPRLSADGKKLALIRRDGQTQDLWVWDLEHGVQNRLTVTPEEEDAPVWSPDGRHIVYALATDALATAIHFIRSDGSAAPKRLLHSDGSQYPFSFSPDGSTLAFAEWQAGKGFDIWTVRIERNPDGDLTAGQPELFVSSNATDWSPTFSPDGRWLAYVSGESGQYEVYVRPFPPGTARWQVSSGGGGAPVWSPRRNELFYRTADDRLVVVSYTSHGDAYVPGKRTLWSEEIRLHSVPVYSNFDVSRDGNRLLVFMPPPGEQASPAGTHLTFLVNYFDELRRRVPVPD